MKFIKRMIISLLAVVLLLAVIILIFRTPDIPLERLISRNMPISRHNFMRHRE